MSYLKYAGLCSDMVRAALVPELRAKARTREVVYYRESVWKDGAPEKQSALPAGLPAVPCHVCTDVLVFLGRTVPPDRVAAWRCPHVACASL
jgi:Mitochondrial ATP synthase epsilon chain